MLLQELCEEGAVIITISICDDEIVQLAQTEAFLQEYSALHPEIELAITAFSSGAALLEHMRVKGAFDIYLLDVIMPGQNGIKLGLNIREFDQGGHIVYLTTSPDFAVDSYRAKASDYLLKPVDKNRLFLSLDGAINTLEKKHQTFAAIKTKEGLRRVPHHCVVYGELVGRRVQYHLSDGSVMEGMSLRGAFQDAVEPLLAHRRFVLCATSFFVNLSFVERIDPSGLLLTGGGVLPVSRAFRSDVTSRWLDYHLERGF